MSILWLVIVLVVMDEIVQYLEKIWPENKAKGLLAQIKFKSELQRGSLSRHPEKFFEGCWLLAPKREDFFKFRFCFFVHDTIINSELPSELNPRDLITESWRLHMVAGFLRKAGMGVFYAFPFGKSFKNLGWKIYKYKDERLHAVDAKKLFQNWLGVGRPSSSHGWSDDLRSEFLSSREEDLLPMLFRELFYTGFIKEQMKKPVSDPYDIDGFLLSYGGAVLPLEIKEKFPASGPTFSFFGIDAGRLLMLLRLCLPNDSNAVYLIREVREKDRTFVGWKFMLLSEIIATASWNLQRGGKGMGGQETQIIRLPYSHFRFFDASFLDEKNMETIKSLPDEMKKLAVEFGKSLEKEYGGASK